MTEERQERRPVDAYELLYPAIPKASAFIMCTRSRKRHWMYSLRVWVKDRETGELRPTTRGLTFSEVSLTSVRDALIAACEKAGVDE